TTTFCIATGHLYSTAGEELPIAASYNGSSISLLKTPTLKDESSLEDVSCVSSSACLAVGHNAEGGGTLALSWSGSQWLTQGSLTPKGKTATLRGVYCGEALACTAVGLATEAGKTVTLAERFSAEWAIQSTPNPASSESSYLSDVSCVSSSFC